MIPRFFFEDRFTIKKSAQTISGGGKVTHTLSVVSTGNLGRFEPTSGSRNREFMGSLKQASMNLFCDYSLDIQVGRIIVKEDDNTEYDIVRADTQTLPGRKHHMELGLELRKNLIA